MEGGGCNPLFFIKSSLSERSLQGVVGAHSGGFILSISESITDVGVDGGSTLSSMSASFPVALYLLAVAVARPFS